MSSALKILVVLGALAAFLFGTLLCAIPITEVVVRVRFPDALFSATFLLRGALLLGPLALFLRTRSLAWAVGAAVSALALALVWLLDWHGVPFLRALVCVGLDAVAVSYVVRRGDGSAPLGIAAGAATLASTALGAVDGIRQTVIHEPLLQDAPEALAAVALILAGAFMWSTLDATPRERVGPARGVGGAGAIVIAVALLTTLFSRAAFGYGGNELFIGILVVLALGFAAFGFGLMQIARARGASGVPLSAIMSWALLVVMPVLGVPLLSSTLAIPILTIPVAVAVVAAAVTLRHAGPLGLAAAIMLFVAIGAALLDALVALGSEQRWELMPVVRSGWFFVAASGFVLAAIAAFTAQRTPAPSPVRPALLA